MSDKTGYPSGGGPPPGQGYPSAPPPSQGYPGPPHPGQGYPSAPPPYHQASSHQQAGGYSQPYQAQAAPYPTASGAPPYYNTSACPPPQQGYCPPPQQGYCPPPQQGYQQQSMGASGKYPGAQVVTVAGSALPGGSGQFDAGARFTPYAPASIPPPPPGCAPNAAQMASAQGHNVVTNQKKGGFFKGSGSGGYTFW